MRKECLAGAFALVSITTFQPNVAAEMQTVFGTPVTMPGPYGFYGGFGLIYQSMGFPNLTSANQAADPATFQTLGQPLWSSDYRVSMVGPGGVIGFGFPDGTLPAWLGQNFRVELGGHWLAGALDFSADPVSPERRRLSLTGVVQAFAGAPSVVRITTAVSQWRSALSAKSDFPLGPQWMLTPVIDVFGGETLSRTTMSETLPNLFLDRTYSRIHWRDIGATVGATFTFFATPSIALHAGARLGIAHRGASLDATKTSGVPPNVVASSSLSVDKSRVTFLPAGEIGATFNPGSSWTIGIVAGVLYDTHVPQFVGPSAPAGSAAGAQGSPADLRFAGAVSGYGMVRMTIRLR